MCTAWGQGSRKWPCIQADQYVFVPAGSHPDFVQVAAHKGSRYMLAERLVGSDMAEPVAVGAAADAAEAVAADALEVDRRMAGWCDHNGCGYSPAEREGRTDCSYWLVGQR